MRSNTGDGRDAVFAALEALEADADVFSGLSFDALTERDCVAVAERLNRIARTIPASHYELVNQLVERQCHPISAVRCRGCWPTGSRSARARRGG